MTVIIRREKLHIREGETWTPKPGYRYEFDLIVNDGTLVIPENMTLRVTEQITSKGYIDPAVKIEWPA